jgi:hypothetical protein
MPYGNMLSDLSRQGGVVTRQISAENPTGEKGGGCKWEPNAGDPGLPHSAAALDLGRGWKVHPFIQIDSGKTATLADIRGSGSINEIFITSNISDYRSLVLRMYWDDEPDPSVEVPLGDFFAIGHDRSPHEVYSIPITVGPLRACSSYWQMPFRKGARITLENQDEKRVDVVAYRILYKYHEVEADVSYFHAQWRRSMTTREYPEHILLDGVKGRGVYVGTYVAWTALSNNWWGEGEMKFYIDGDTTFPSFADNGTEDYFGGAWGFGYNDHGGREKVFNSPFLGLPLAKIDDTEGPRRYSLYRWHILDSIGFASSIKATIQALGLGWMRNKGRYEPLTDDIASVCYWYQDEPHSSFPKIPPVWLRWGR